MITHNYENNYGSLTLKNVNHSYRNGTQNYNILKQVSLSILKGETCSITGISGSGKSTLLNIIGLLEQPTTGEVFISGINMSNKSENERAKARNKIIGFVFQGFNLLPRLNALDNVALPLLYRGLSKTDARKEAIHYLGLVGLSEKLLQSPADLSGGQKQRVAIARALIGKPHLLLADEPTGNLDKNTAKEIIELLISINKDSGTTLVMITHDEKIASMMERKLKLRDGNITEVRNAI